MSYDEVRSFHLYDTRYLFFDIFARNNEVICICPIYSAPNNTNLSDIKIDSDDVVFTGLKVASYIEYEPTFVFIYSYKPTANESITVTVEYQNTIREYTLPQPTLSPLYTLSATTLFLHDYAVIPLYMGYYKQQGVEHFYLYYNGDIKDIDTEKIPTQNVTLIPWNFHYMYDTGKFVHHAQMGQLNHALYKYAKPQSRYILNCDIDEYMHVKNQTLSELLESSKPCYLFRNYWSKTLDGTIPDTMLPTTILKSTTTSGKFRTKYICNPQLFGGLGIHCPKRYPLDENTDHLQLLHFEGISNGRVNDCVYETYTT